MHCSVCGVLSEVRLCDPMDSSSPGSSVHGILQARILEWVAISSLRGSSQPRIPWFDPNLHLNPNLHLFRLLLHRQILNH